MKQRRKISIHSCSDSDFRRAMLLSFSCMIGILFGCFAASHVSADAKEQLHQYLSTFIRLDQAASEGVLFFRALMVYFRNLLLLVLLSFSVAGVYLIPAVFTVLGFRLAFAVMLFSSCVEGGILATLSLFSARCLFVLPMTLYFGCAAILAAGRGKECRKAAFWRRLAICAGILLLGTVLEVTLVPKLFDLVHQAK